MTAPAHALEFREVFEAHVGFVWRTLRYHGVRDRDLDDVVQEAFLVVHRKLAEWKPEADIRPWLFAICRNAARDHRKRAHVRLEHPDEGKNEGTPWSPNEQLEARAALARVEQALSGVPDEQREVFLLYEVEGWDMATIAAALAIPAKTGYSRLRLAREFLIRERQKDLAYG